jgi:arsenate reductase
MRPDLLPAGLLRELLMENGTVLFVCIENACRSLMAEAMFNDHPPAGWVAVSAGTRPSTQAHPRTAPMLREIGLTPPTHPPQVLTNASIKDAGLRVTMGCLDDASCPVALKMGELRDWGLPDPATLDDDGFRRVRDELLLRVRNLKSELAGDRAAPPV